MSEKLNAVGLGDYIYSFLKFEY